MPKLPAIKPQELIKKLKKLGFIKNHQKGNFTFTIKRGWHFKGRSQSITRSLLSEPSS